MKRRHFNRLRKRSAFTLLEVLLVLVIIVVIAGFGIQSLMSNFDRAKINAAKGMMGMLSSGLKRYQLNVGNLPSSLDALYEAPSDLADPSAWTQELDKPVPLDPWGTAYIYNLEGSKFTLTSAGPDKQPGTADDVSL